jgi:hypothetical protein
MVADVGKVERGLRIASEVMPAPSPLPLSA